MIKTLAMFAAIFVLAFCGFSYMGIHEMKVHAAIARAPATTLAKPVMVNKVSGKRRRFRVVYGYEAGGAGYTIESRSMDEGESQAAMAGPAVEVVYASGQPSMVEWKRAYDRHEPNETRGGALRYAAMMALAIALLASVSIGWKYGWLRF